MRRLVMLLSLLIALSLIIACAPAGQQSAKAADFYKANPITIIVPNPPGGGTDPAARVFALFWPAVTGGKAVVENKPEGAGIEGLNYLTQAKPDGLTLSVADLGTTVVTPILLKSPGVRYNFDSFDYIGFVPHLRMAFSVAPHVPSNSMAELQKVEGLKFGGTGITGYAVMTEVMVAELLQLKNAKVVPGFDGRAGVKLAAKKGEIDGYSFNAAYMYADAKDGFCKPPFFIMDYERAPFYPELPAVTELVKMSAETKKLFEIYTTLGITGKVLIVPKGVPKDRVDFLVNVFNQIASDKSAIEQFQKEQTDFKAGSLDKLLAMIKTARGVSDEDLAKINAVVRKWTPK